MYEDKFLLAEHLTNTSVAAALNCLEALELSELGLSELQAWVGAGSAVSLRFESSQSSSLVTKITRDAKGPTTVTTTTTSQPAGMMERVRRKSVEMMHSIGVDTAPDTVRTATVTKLTEYVHRVTIDWRIIAFYGSDSSAAGNRIVLQERTGTYTIVTSTEVAPATWRPTGAEEVNITWMLQQLDATQQLQFAIDRSAKECRTPRRNPQILTAVNVLSQLQAWASAVVCVLRNLSCDERMVAQPKVRPCLVTGYIYMAGTRVMPAILGWGEEGLTRRAE